MNYLEKLDMLPSHMRDTMRLWIEHAYQPGSFLTAVLSNDLKEAFARADDVNTAAMRDWVMYLYNYAPSGCHGSPARFSAWMKAGGLSGMQEAA